MTNAPKKKGTSWETAVVNYLHGCGFLARRKALTGSSDEGDIELPELPGIVVEAKNCKGQTLAQWVDEAVREAENASVPVGVVWHRRRLSARQQSTSPGAGYVTMSGEHFTRLLTELRRLQHAENGRPD